MNFGKALDLMRDGKAVAREAWDGRTLELIEPGPNAQMTLPYIYETSGNGDCVPWAASHQELLATDWGEV
jgi:hypothetical protein